MRSLLIIVGCVVGLLAAGPAEAQTADPQTGDPQSAGPQGVPPSRPYQGIFAQSRTLTDQSLTFQATLGGGYDTNVLSGGAGGATSLGASISPVPPIGPAVPSTFENASGALSYLVGGQRGSFNANAQTAATYYGSFGAKPLNVSDSGGFGGVWHVTQRTDVTANATASYGPFYSLPGVPAVPVAPDDASQTGSTGLAPGQTLVLDSGSSLIVENHWALLGSVGLTHFVTRRLSFSLTYGDSSITSPSHQFDLSLQSYSGGFTYLLAKGLSAQLSYVGTTGSFDAGQSTPTTSRGLTGGLVFNRSLSITRRTVFTFGSGLAGYSNSVVLNGRTQYFLSLQATLAREIGRTWTATVGYNRGAAFVETFQQPVFSDAVTVGLGGRISRRLQVQSSVGVTTGNIGLLGSSNDAFHASFASLGLRVDASRTASVGLDYSYYRYHFAGGIQLPPGFGPQSDSQSVRVYVSLWAPLMSRGRRTNAAR